jgi:hypothetical protein
MENIGNQAEIVCLPGALLLEAESYAMADRSTSGNIV